MHDADIRRALRTQVLARHRNEPDTLVVEELGLECGTSRVDIAVINGQIHGFEIKSPRDTLDRLPGQIEAYNRTLDQVTIVTHGRHLDEVLRLVPDWWGVKEVVEGVRGGVRFRQRRYPKNNPAQVPMSLARLLWREELLDVLAGLGADAGCRSKTRDVLCAQLLEQVPVEEARRLVRMRLKARGDWRSGPSPFRGGDSSRSSAKSLHSQANRQWLLSLRSPRPPS